MKPTDYIELGLHLKSTEKGYALLSVSYNLNTTTLSDNVVRIAVRCGKLNENVSKTRID